jgi:hypothetical protein
MSEKFPEDIVDTIVAFGEEYTEAQCNEIARAILAERERCAAIVDGVDGWESAELIAAIIRAAPAHPASDPTAGSTEGRRGA